MYAELSGDQSTSCVSSEKKANVNSNGLLMLIHLVIHIIASTKNNTISQVQFRQFAATKWIAPHPLVIPTKDTISTSLELTLFVKKNPGVDVGTSHQGFSV
jgi:hypothetical protein